MKKLRQNGFPDMKYYSMKDFVVDWPKIDYKLHMHPTELICPVSLEWVPFTEDLKKKILSRDYETLNDGSKPFETVDKETAKNYVQRLRVLSNKK